MNSLIQALQTIVKFFETQQIQYMVIGGIATSIYGIPRQTFNIDIKFSLAGKKIEEFLSILASVTSIVPEDPITFIKETGVVPIELNGVRIDLILARLPFEQESLQRSKKQTVFGVDIIITSIEDLIIQKAISPRGKDWMDIEGIVENHGSELDWSYTLEHIKQLSEFLADTTIYSKIKKLKDATGL